jgi:hypothetical protein
LVAHKIIFRFSLTYFALVNLNPNSLLLGLEALATETGMSWEPTFRQPDLFWDLHE